MVIYSQLLPETQQACVDDEFANGKINHLENEQITMESIFAVIDLIAIKLVKGTNYKGIHIFKATMTCPTMSDESLVHLHPNFEMKRQRVIYMLEHHFPQRLRSSDHLFFEEYKTRRRYSLIYIFRSD